MKGVPRIIVMVTSRANMEVRTEEQEVQEECFKIKKKKAEVILLLDNVRKNFYSSFGKVSVELVMTIRKRK